VLGSLGGPSLPLRPCLRCEPSVWLQRAACASLRVAVRCACGVRAGRLSVSVSRRAVYVYVSRQRQTCTSVCTWLAGTLRECGLKYALGVEKDAGAVGLPLPPLRISDSESQ